MCSGETKPLGNASFECHVLSFIAVTLNTVLEMFEQVPELETPSGSIGGDSRIDNTFNKWCKGWKCAIICFSFLQLAWSDFVLAFELTGLEDVQVQ